MSSTRELLARHRPQAPLQSCGELSRQFVAAAVKAAREADWAWLFERAYGKPEQRVEVETAGTLGEIAAMTPEERKALRARLLREHPELRELVPRAERDGF